jgi:hypothetical protein
VPVTIWRQNIEKLSDQSRQPRLGPLCFTSMIRRSDNCGRDLALRMGPSARPLFTGSVCCGERRVRMCTLKGCRVPRATCEFGDPHHPASFRPPPLLQSPSDASLVPRRLSLLHSQGSRRLSVRNSDRCGDPFALDSFDVGVRCPLQPLQHYRLVCEVISSMRQT